MDIAEDTIDEEVFIKSEPLPEEDPPEDRLQVDVEDTISFVQCLICQKVITRKDTCCLEKTQNDEGNDNRASDQENITPAISTDIQLETKPKTNKAKKGRKPIYNFTSFECIFCSKPCNNRQQLDIHILTHIKEKPNVCKYCPSSFSDNAALRRHTMALHTGGLPGRYGCSFCPKKFYHTGHLEVHENFHTSRRPFVCDICPDKRYAQKQHLTIHMRTHTKERPYQCPLCPKSFTSHNALNSHRRSHSDVRLFHCKLCDASYRSSTSLQRHMRAIHTGERPFECGICGWKFCDNSNLALHTRSHKQDKRYICAFCGRGFVQSGALAIHVRVHIQEKPFECKICGKGFPSQTDMSKHAKSHLAIKPYNCVFCDKDVKQKKSFYNHLIMHVGETPFACSLCDLMFRSRDCRKRHVRKSHS